VPAGVTIDKTDLLSVESSLKAIKSGAPDAIRFATNDSLSALKTASSREIRKRVTAKLTPVNKSLTIKKMFKTDMSANITCTGKPLPLINYKHTVTVKGVKAQVKIPGSTKLIRHSFIATVKAGTAGKTHTGIFWRAKNIRSANPKWPVGKKRKLPSPDKHSALLPYQLKITERFGPRVPDVMKEDSVMGPILQEASDRYDNRLEYHTEQLLAKARAA
jgi:hypothetical protein